MQLVESVAEGFNWARTITPEKFEGMDENLYYDHRND